MSTNTPSAMPLSRITKSIRNGLLCLALASPMAYAQSFSVPTGELGNALSKFAADSGVVVYFDASLTQGKKTLGLDGDYSVTEALTKLLNGTGLKVVAESDGSYRVIAPVASDGSMVLDVIEVQDTAVSNVSQGTGLYTIKSSTSATGMDLGVLETPQSISVVTAEKMADFQLTNINQVLENTVGITVEKMESDRTQFTARGHEVTNFLIDGVSLPLNYSYQYGDIDMALYDRVEVVRGATGLTTANGDPSATINLVRKRPTEEFQAEGKISAGTWKNKRADLDVSGALNENKTIKARAIAAIESGESHLDRYESDSSLFSAIVEADLAKNTVLTAGITRYEDENDGTQWGGIPAFDGINYDVSTNAASNWAYRDVVTTDVFVELAHDFTNDWQLKTTYSYKDIDQDANLINLWVSGGVLEIDGVQDYQLESKEHVLNFTVNGKYNLFDRQHDLVVGFDLAKRDLKEVSNYDTDLLGTAIDLRTWNGSTATPVFDDRTDGTDYEEEQQAFFIATNLNVTDQLSLLLGTRVSNWEREGMGYWDTAWDSEDNEVYTPYAGVVYKITDTLSTYASYTTTFKPQSYIDENASYIDPTEGENFEIGLKSAFFDDRMLATFAVFKTKQDNVAEWAGTLTDGSGRSYYSAEDGIETEGFEVEISGKPIDSVNISLGYTSLDIEDSEGEDAQTYIPTKTTKLAVTYQPEALKALKVGASVNHQNSTDIEYWYGSAEQDGYTLVNLMASYQVNDDFKVSANVDNLTDKKYYGSLIKPYVNYAAPRSVNVSMSYQF